MKQKSLVVACYAAPALLCLVACSQRYVAAVHGLDSWKGGGFGMYASVHAKANRLVSVTVKVPGGVEQRIGPRNLEGWLPMSGGMHRTRDAILMLPTENRVRSLARELAQSEWVLVPGQSVPLLRMDVPEATPAEPVELEMVRVDIWQYQFTPRARLLELTNLIHAEEEVETP